MILYLESFFQRKILHGLDHVHQKGNTTEMDGNLDVKRIKGKGEAAKDADEDTNCKTAAEAFDPCTHGQAGCVESLTQGNMHYAGIGEKIQYPKTWETKPLSSSSLWRVSLPDRAAFSLSIFLSPHLSETSHFHPSRGVLDKGGTAALWTTDPSLVVLSLQTVTTLEFHPAPSLCFHSTHLLYCHRPLYLIHVSHPPNLLF